MRAQYSNETGKIEEQSNESFDGVSDSNKSVDKQIAELESAVTSSFMNAQIMN